MSEEKKEEKQMSNIGWLIGIGIILVIIGFFFFPLLIIGLFLIAYGIYHSWKLGILSEEEVIDNWGFLIKKGNGRAEEVFKDIEALIQESKVPSIKTERKEMVPSLIRGILGKKRDFIVAKDASFRLKPYQIFINARDYGENLDVSWYLTYRLPLWRALLRFIPGLATASSIVESLDLFDQQDLTCYATNCHHSLLKAVERQMMALNQDPSKIERKSRGFLGIS